VKRNVKDRRQQELWFSRCLRCFLLSPALSQSHFLSSPTQVNPRETTIFSKTIPRNSTKPSGGRGQGRVLRDDTRKPKPLSIQEQMLADAQAAATAATATAATRAEGGGSVDIRNIVPASMRGQQGKEDEVKDLFELAQPTDNFQERKIQLINELD
jgi:hypothetical protein